MNQQFSFRKFCVMCLTMFVVVSVLVACSGQQTEPESSHPPRVPANNYKPDLITENNAFVDVPVFDKFGTWPQKSGDQYYSSDVGTWYTIWWQKEGDPNFVRWYLEDWTRLKPVDYGYYNSGDPDYLTSVLVRMKYIGIDFLVLDDSNSPKGGGYYVDIATNLSMVFKTANSLSGYTPKIAIATGGAFRDYNDKVQQQKDFDRYYKLIEKAPEVAYMYEGKPLLIMYMAGNLNAQYQDNQNRFTQRYGTGFISLQKNSIYESLYKTQGNWGWVWDMQNPDSEIMGVQPGYNKAHQGVYYQTFPRDNGVRYTQMWLEAIKTNPKVIMIPSYNDHAEETGWEATTPIRPAISSAAQDVPGEDPYVYEKITEAYLALRYGYIEGFFYQVENTKQVYQCVDGYLEKVKASAAEDAGEPVILLPKGYIEWELNRDRGL